MMELDELKTQWQEHNRQLEKSLRLNRELLSAAKLKPAESALRRLALWAGLEAGMWFMIVVALGSFIAGHIRMPALLVSAAALAAMPIAIVIALIWQMAGALRIDFGQPVAAIQKRVESLRMLRIRTTQWAVLGGTLLWVPALAVAIQAIFGIDIYKSVDLRWLIMNVLFGAALFPAAIWASKKFGARMGRSPFIQRLMNDLAGKNLTAARGFLVKLREFESEQEAV
jgi:hypothetical protein